MANYYIDYTNGNDARTGLRIPTTSYNTVDSTADTTHLTDAALTGADDYINGSFLWNQTRSAGSLITDFDTATDTATLGTAIVGMSAGDEYYILDSWKTINQYTTTTARTAGDIAYLRANMTHTQGAADIVMDEDGTVAAYISIIGCDSVTNDPWHDASDVLPTIDFGDATYDIAISGDDYWYLERLNIIQSADTVGNVKVDGSDGLYMKGCNITDNSASSNKYGMYVGVSYNIKIENCVFKDNIVYNLYITEAEVLVTGCTFNGGVATTDYGIYNDYGSTVQILDCTFGSTTAHDFDDIRTVGYGGKTQCRNCTFNMSSLSINDANTRAWISSEDDDGTFGKQVVYYKNGTVTKDATARAGGASSSAKLMPTSVCGVNYPLSISPFDEYDFKVWLAADTSKTITIYMRSVTTWSGTYPTAAQCYVSFSYLSNAATAARTTVTTNEVFSDATTWVAFDSGAIVPARSGWVYIKVYLGKYTASNGIYVDIQPQIA